MKRVHCKRAPYTVYAGRPGPLGNPFVIGVDGTREQVVEKFRQHALADENLLAVIERLRPEDVLGCWCGPKQTCHCDVIIEIWKERRAAATNLERT